MKRRNFIQCAAAAIPVTMMPIGAIAACNGATHKINLSKVKISLNAYSFDKPLRAGEMTIHDMIDFCADTGFEGVDLTGYYFPGYPSVPSNDYIYSVKRHAFRKSIEICGTGVRNNFTLPDASKRADEKKHIKEWIEVASKLGAQTLRIFAGGKGAPDGYTREQTAAWIADDIRECAEFASRNGVVLALQNHYDFLQTADQVLDLFSHINHEWVGLMLDIGSYRSADPYAEIERTIHHAITWQVKEEMFVNNKPVKTDLNRLKSILDAASYRGYLPIETLGNGDPKQKVEFMYREVSRIMN